MNVKNMLISEYLACKGSYGQHPSQGAAPWAVVLSYFLGGGNYDRIPGFVYGILFGYFLRSPVHTPGGSCVV